MLGEAPLITTARQKTHLEDALGFLRAFLETGKPFNYLV